MLRTTACQQAGVEVVVKCAESLAVAGDLTKLRQIVVNLVSNSLKFTKAGVVRLAAMHDADGQLLLAVEDTGPGIPPEDRPRLFNKYEQLDKHRVQGTGIGLASVQGSS